MSISSTAKISGFNKWLNPFSGSIRFRAAKILFALSLSGGIYGGVNSVTNNPKLNVSASCSDELQRCMLDIRGVNVDFTSRMPVIEVPKESGLVVLKPTVFSKDRAQAAVSFEDADPGKWDVVIDGIKYPKAIELGE